MKSCRKGQFAFETLWPLVKSLQGILTASPLLGNDLEEEWHKVVMAPPSLASFSPRSCEKRESISLANACFSLFFHKKNTLSRNVMLNQKENMRLSQ